MKKGIVISGGGSFGAFTAGKLYMRHNKYAMGHGVSTGALMIIAALLNKLDVFKRYAEVSQKQITEVSPWTKKGKLSIPFVVKRLLMSLIFSNVKTLGESKNLKKLIDQNYSQEDYTRLRDEGMTAIVGAYSLNACKVFNARSDKIINFERFKSFIWASANAGPLMSIADIKRNEMMECEQWTDGGLEDNLNATILFEEGCKEVDLFVHKSKEETPRKGNVKNIIHFIFRIVKALFKSNYEADIKAAIDSARDYNATLRIHYIPQEIEEDNPFYMDQDKMKKWFKMGQDMSYDYNLIDIFDFR